MAIEGFLDMDIPESFTVSYELQSQLKELAREGGEGAGEMVLLQLALAVVNLESRLTAMSADILDRKSENDELRAEVLDLETRLIRSGISVIAAK